MYRLRKKGVAGKDILSSLDTVSEYFIQLTGKDYANALTLVGLMYLNESLGKALKCFENALKKRGTRKQGRYSDKLPDHRVGIWKKKVSWIKPWNTSVVCEKYSKMQVSG